MERSLAVARLPLRFHLFFSFMMYATDAAGVAGAVVLAIIIWIGFVVPLSFGQTLWGREDDNVLADHREYAAHVDRGRGDSWRVEIRR